MDLVVEKALVGDSAAVWIDGTRWTSVSRFYWVLDGASWQCHCPSKESPEVHIHAEAFQALKYCANEHGNGSDEMDGMLLDGLTNADPEDDRGMTSDDWSDDWRDGRKVMLGGPRGVHGTVADDFATKKIESGQSATGGSEEAISRHGGEVAYPCGPNVQTDDLGCRDVAAAVGAHYRGHPSDSNTGSSNSSAKLQGDAGDLAHDGE